MTWEPELDELRRREALAEQLGGDDKVERQHHFGKLTVRERIDRDRRRRAASGRLGKTAGVARYDEHGELVEFTPSNFVFGIAELDGRPAVVSGDDFTVRGGSNDASISAKREASEAIAVEMRLPHVRLLDGMSGGGSVKTIEQAGRTYIPVLPGWHIVVDHLDIAPSVSLVLGSVAGFGAARAVASHYSVMVRGTSQMMIAGPALVEQAGSRRRVEGGAGPRRHPHRQRRHRRRRRLRGRGVRAGAALPVLPALQRRRTAAAGGLGRRSGPPRRLAARHGAPKSAPVVRHAGDPRTASSTTARSSRSAADWGTSIVGGLARLDGVPVAVFGENPMMYGGGWTADSCRKLTRLIDLASMFKLPMVHFEDCPGFLIGNESEQRRNRALRHDGAGRAPPGAGARTARW